MNDIFSHALTERVHDIYLIVLLYNERPFLTEHLEQRERRQAVISFYIHSEVLFKITALCVLYYLAGKK